MKEIRSPIVPDKDCYNRISVLRTSKQSKKCHHKSLRPEYLKILRLRPFFSTYVANIPIQFPLIKADCSFDICRDVEICSFHTEN